MPRTHDWARGSPVRPGLVGLPTETSPLDQSPANQNTYLGLMNGLDRSQSQRWQRWAPVLAAAAVIAAGASAWAITATGNPADWVDEPEVCTTTEYEGCPGRWEVEWANPRD